MDQLIDSITRVDVCVFICSMNIVAHTLACSMYWILKIRRSDSEREKARPTPIWWCEIWISDQICLIARISFWWAQFILLYACNHVHSFDGHWIENSTRDSAIITMNDKWQNLSATHTRMQRTNVRPFNGQARAREREREHKSAYPDQKLLIFKAIQS